MSIAIPKEDEKDGRKERAGSASCYALFSDVIGPNFKQRVRVASRVYNLASFLLSMVNIGTGYLSLEKIFLLSPYTHVTSIKNVVLETKFEYGESNPELPRIAA